MQTSPTIPSLLGIEGGGTHTVALLSSAPANRIERGVFGPGNLRLLTDAALVALFREIAGRFPSAGAIGVGMPGARTEQDRQRILAAVSKVWPGTPCRATHDLETALLAAPSTRASTRVVVLSGTGSCCYGMDARGKSAKLGGWGHILGDKGSAFEIGLRALKAVVYYLDREGAWGVLGESILRQLALNQPEDLINWVKEAPKDQVAALARLVFEAAEARDMVARDILRGAVASLARDAVDCAARLVTKNREVQFILAGGNFAHQPAFATSVGREIARLRPKSIVGALFRETAWGALQVAAGLDPVAGKPAPLPKRKSQVSLPSPVPQATAQSPTEGRNPRSSKLDKLAPAEFARLMLEEEQGVAAKILTELPALTKAMRLTANALKRGGRMFYAGAGTSGRLGVLDASECPPTFRVSPEMVQGIMAGGHTALWSAVEGAEDNIRAGAEAVAFRGVRRGDVLVGIAASGRTPFVWGALQAAREAGAGIILISFNPHLRFAKGLKPDAVIAVDLGAELLTGSTRLKAGTATKLVLNLLSTHAMVRLGKVRGNLMIDLNPSNVKLRDRAVRIVRELTGLDEAAARARLVAANWVVRAAL